MNFEQILVTSYVDPDLDGFACAFAYTEFLTKQDQQAVFGISGDPHEETKFLLDKYKIAFQSQSLSPANFDKVILVDASEVEGIDPKINLDKVVEVVDHRRVNQKELFKNAKTQIEFVGAAATLIAEKFMTTKTEISNDSAVLLYGAIVSNTLNFRANVTTDRDRTAASWLATKVLPDKDFIHDLFQAKSQINNDNLSERIEHDLALFNFSKKITVGQLEIVEGDKFVSECKAEILGKLRSSKEALGSDIIFLSVIDLDANQNIFVTEDLPSQDLLRSIFNIAFQDNVAKRPGFIMRKEIMPLIKEKINAI